ncbi:MAG: saccharopine dehydrogenase NADP-binding domain-containing protein [bacterium]
MAAPRVLILGGYGETGKRLAGMLVSRANADVIIAGRNGEKAHAIAENINRDAGSRRAQPLALDARNLHAFRSALDGVRLVAHAGPALGAGITRKLAQAAISTGVDWIDVQIDPAQSAALRDLDSQARERNVCLAIQSGFHPGLPAAMIRWAAAMVDALPVAEVFSYLNPDKGLVITQGVDELIDLFRNYRVRLLEDGVWHEMSMWDKRAMRKFEFDFGFGMVACAAMALDELENLPETVPGLRRAGFFIGGSDPITNWITTPILFIGLKLLPFLSNSFWAKLWVGSMKLFGRPPFGTALQLAAIGKVGDKEKSVRLSISHPDEYVLTAAPVCATVAQMLDGSARRPGVHYAAHLPEPERMLADMETLGLRIVRGVPS